MSLPVPKYKKGDVVYLASTTTIGAKHECPDCKGTGKWPIVSPAGIEMDMDCPRCNFRSYNRDDLSLEYTKYVNSVKALTIGSVRIDTSDEENPITYMCVETGIGSGSVYTESRFCETKEHAEETSSARCAEQQAELDATPRAMQKAQSGRMGYFNAMRDSMVRNVEEEVTERLRSEFNFDDESEISPGIWKARGEISDDGHYRFSVRADDLDGYNGLEVCSGYGGLSEGFAKFEHGAANARLIAAAPDMLNALVDAVEVFEIEVAQGNDTIAAMKEAIAKAKGLS